MKEYIALATCILPDRMLDWFNLKDVRLTEENGKTSIHIYLDENEKTPDDRTDLRPNGFTRESVFHDFPIRGQEVLLHVRRRRKELAAFLKDAFGDVPYNGPFV